MSSISSPLPDLKTPKKSPIPFPTRLLPIKAITMASPHPTAPIPGSSSLCSATASCRKRRDSCPLGCWNMNATQEGVLSGDSQHSSSSKKVDALLDSLKWDDKGLVVAIAQNLDSGAIMMQGFANRDAVATTITSRKATFFSRSRSSLWTKGETSSNFIHVHDIFVDCDRDSVIYLGKPDGPTCHTGAETCYYTSVSDILKDVQIEEQLALTTLYSLENTISHRRDEIGATHGKPSWTKRLLSNQELLCSKVREEAEELVQTLLGDEDRSRVASEMADLLYHAMVLLSVRHVKMEEVFEVLRKRFSQSGIEEKNSRKNSSN